MSEINERREDDDLDAILAPLPPEARMDPYYYSFTPTGVGVIDSILSAVAVAGKGAHHTELWDDEDAAYYYEGRPGITAGKSAVDTIQKTAEASAAAVLAALASRTVETAEEWEYGILTDRIAIPCDEEFATHRRSPARAAGPWEPVPHTSEAPDDPA